MSRRHSPDSRDSAKGEKGPTYFIAFGYLIHMYMSFIISFAFYFLSEKLDTVSENFQYYYLKSVIMICSKDC